MDEPIFGEPERTGPRTDAMRRKNREAKARQRARDKAHPAELFYDDTPPAGLNRRGLGRPGGKPRLSKEFCGLGRCGRFDRRCIFHDSLHCLACCVAAGQSGTFVVKPGSRR